LWLLFRKNAHPKVGKRLGLLHQPNPPLQRASFWPKTDISFGSVFSRPISRTLGELKIVLRRNVIAKIGRQFADHSNDWIIETCLSDPESHIPTLAAKTMEPKHPFGATSQCSVASPLLF
jgi:hypothetical protein